MKIQELRQIIKEELYNQQINKYNHLSDEEVVNWAKEDGWEDIAEFDYLGNLINREEVLNLILGTETPNTDIDGDFIDPKGKKLDIGKF